MSKLLLCLTLLSCPVLADGQPSPIPEETGVCFHSCPEAQSAKWTAQRQLTDRALVTWAVAAGHFQACQYLQSHNGEALPESEVRDYFERDWNFQYEEQAQKAAIQAAMETLRKGDVRCTWVHPRAEEEQYRVESRKLARLTEAEKACPLKCVPPRYGSNLERTFAGMLLTWNTLPKPEATRH